MLVCVFSLAIPNTLPPPQPKAPFPMQALDRIVGGMEKKDKKLSQWERKVVPGLSWLLKGEGSPTSPLSHWPHCVFSPQEHGSAFFLWG